MQGGHFELSGHADRPKTPETPKTPKRLDCLELIPGLIHGDWVANHILTRLSWQTLYSVVSVHKNWRESIMTGEVYRAKQHGQTTSTFLAIPFGMHDERGFYQSIYIFDPRRETWTLLPPIASVMEGVPIGAALCFVMGKLFVIGGSSKSFVLDKPYRTLFMLDLGVCHSTWARKQDLPWSRKGFACHAFDNTIYLCGGRTQMGKDLRSTYAYHLENDVWERVANMSNFYSRHHLCRMGDRLIVRGGLVSPDGNLTGAKPVRDVQQTESYDPKADTWTIVPNVPIDLPPPFKQAPFPTFPYIPIRPIPPFQEREFPFLWKFPLYKGDILRLSLNSVQRQDWVNSSIYEVSAIDTDGEIHAQVEEVSRTIYFVRISVMDRKFELNEVALPSDIEELDARSPCTMFAINL